MNNLWRDDRPSNTLDGRKVRELEPRLMEEGEMKEEIEDEVMEEEREIRERTKAVESIESPRFNCNKIVGFENSKMMERSEGRNEWRRE